MYCGELKEHSPDYRSGHSKGIERAFSDAREEICKYMYKTKKKKLSMYEICSLLHSIEHDLNKFCDTYGMALGYSEDDSMLLQEE